MSIVEKRSAGRDVDPLAEGAEMSPVTSICVGLVLALVIYALATRPILLRDPNTTVPRITKSRPRRHLSVPKFRPASAGVAGRDKPGVHNSRGKQFERRL